MSLEAGATNNRYFIGFDLGGIPITGLSINVDLSVKDGVIVTSPVTMSETATAGLYKALIDLTSHTTDADWLFHFSSTTSDNDGPWILRDKALAGLTTGEKADVNTEADIALSDYDPPTRAEATTDKNEIITDLDDIKGTGFVKDIDSLVDIAHIGIDADTLKSISDQLDIAQADLDNATQYKADVTNLDVAVSTRSSHSASDIWAVGTRTLTSFGTLITDIWTSITRTITGFTIAGKAEIETEATNALNVYDPPTRAEATVDKDAIITEINNNEMKLDRILGLSKENTYIHTTVFDGNNNMTSAKYDTYDTKTNADIHDGSTGIVSKYTITATFTGSNMTSFKMVRDI